MSQCSEYIVSIVKIFTLLTPPKSSESMIISKINVLIKVSSYHNGEDLRCD